MPDAPPIDLSLLRGARFHCRPDCGLCCYTSPSITPTEHYRLLQIEPELSVLEDPGGRGRGLAHLGARNEGGACQLLEHSRCRAHLARPFPCRSFPLYASMERHLQVSLVLSCPGVDLSHLGSWASGAAPRNAPEGLDGEIAAVETEARDPEVPERSGRIARAWERGLRRLRKREGDSDLDEVAEALAKDPPLPTEESFPATPPPAAEEDLELLPLSFDERRGIVAWREVDHGWELVSLREEGGIREVLGAFPPPDRLPRMDNEGRSLLRGYLSYVARREHFRSLVLFEWLKQERETPQEVAVDLLQELGAQTLARGLVLSMLKGHATELLGRLEVESGVRAVDMDYLDQTTLGEQL